MTATLLIDGKEYPLDGSRIGFKPTKGNETFVMTLDSVSISNQIQDENQVILFEYQYETAIDTDYNEH